MSSVTTVAALLSLRVNDISLAVDSELSAGCSHIGQNSTAEQIISSISTVHSLSILLYLIIPLTIDSVMRTILNVSLIVGDLEGVRKLRRVLSKGYSQQDCDGNCDL